MQQRSLLEPYGKKCVEKSPWSAFRLITQFRFVDSPVRYFGSARARETNANVVALAPIDGLVVQKIGPVCPLAAAKRLEVNSFGPNLEVNYTRSDKNNRNE